MDLEGTKNKLRDALDANADAVLSSAKDNPGGADAFAGAALKLAQALATLGSTKL